MDYKSVSIEEMTSTLLSNCPFIETYSKVERMFYGLYPASLGALMQEIVARMKDSLEKVKPTKSKSELYDPSFYQWIQLGSQRSANAIVPLLTGLIHPHSVVDVGCGNGIWLSTFAKYGVETTQGVDGPWVNVQDLTIPKDMFRAADLRTFEPQNREQYDLVFSVECAEHIEKEYAARFVRTLCDLGHIVCFSAAIPFQGGVGHVNEQWPEYWARLFSENGYHAADWIRPRIWLNPEVESWYAQNLFLFADSFALESNSELAKCCGQTDISLLSRIHPSHYLKVVMFLLPQAVEQGMY